MFTETITWAELPQFSGQHVIIFGTDKPATDLVQYIRKNYADITIDYFIDYLPSPNHTLTFMGLPVVSPASAVESGQLEEKTVIIANVAPMPALNALLDANPAAVFLCSRQLHAMFHSARQAKCVKATKTTMPFCMDRGTPQIPAIITNAYQKDGPCGPNIFEIADFEKQEYTRFTMPTTNIPLSLKEFSEDVPQDTLPMRMSHLSYLLWKKSIHVTQLSPSRRYFLGIRYNFLGHA